MRITSFDPLLWVKDAEPIVRLFEDLGFEKRHKLENVTEQDITGIVMRDPNGFRINLIQTEDLPRESLTGIRMNVDDFDEAYTLLTSRGFTKAPGTDIVDTGSAKALMMIFPSRFLLELIQHIRK